MFSRRDQNERDNRHNHLPNEIEITDFWFVHFIVRALKCLVVLSNFISFSSLPHWAFCYVEKSIFNAILFQKKKKNDCCRYYWWVWLCTNGRSFFLSKPVLRRQHCQCPMIYKMHAYSPQKCNANSFCFYAKKKKKKFFHLVLHVVFGLLGSFSRYAHCKC